MKLRSLWIPVGAMALAVGCSGGTSPSALAPEEPGSPAAPAAAGLGQVYQQGDLAQGASGIWTMHVDPTTISATLALKSSRSGQKNDDLYDLSVDAFFGPGTIEVVGVNSDGTTIDVKVRVTHPFAAPTNLAGPATAGNRADLGVATRLMVMADGTGYPSYFTATDNVSPNTGLVANADGYLDPKGMIVTTLTNGAYPFLNVIDEELDNREGGITNGASVTGNYDPTNGWTQATMGTGNNGWTGFEVLHQGQSALVNAQLDIAAVTALGGYDFDLVPIVKYNDPRQGANAATKRANRLPPATPDATKFGYRMPHGALDVSAVAYDGEDGTMQANAVTATDVHFHVVDWDARGTESAETDLSIDATLGNVAQGESGAPVVEVDVPGVLGAVTALTATDDDSGQGGDAAADSGYAGDAIYYTASLTNTGSGQPTGGGPVVGLLRATDIEAGAAFNDTWRFALDPDLGLITTDPPEPIVYQAFTIELTANSQAPTYTTVTGAASVGTGSTWTCNINGLADAESDPLTIEIDWDNNGTFTPEGTVNSPYPGAVPRTSPITYTFVGPAPDTRTVPVRISDGFTVVNVTPSPTFQVTPCASDSYTPTVYGGPGWPNTSSGWTPTGDAIPANNIATGDISVMRWGGGSTNRGAIIQHMRRIGSTTPFSEISKYHISGSATITSWGANMFDKQIHQLEVDSTNRVLFARKGTDLTSYSPITTVYPPATGAEADIYYFTYSGAIVPWASVTTFSTGGTRTVAMCLDQQDNVYTVDTNNVLHKWVKTSAYAEQLTGGYPIDLKAAPLNLTLTGVGAGDCKIHDLVMDWRTGSFFILVQTLEAAGAPGNGYIYRLDCDGFHPLVAGNVNPYRFILNASATQSLAADISIDQIDFNGNALPPASSQGSSQLIVTSGNTSGSDLRCMSTNLTLLFSVEPTFGCLRGIPTPDNLLANSNPSNLTIWFPYPAAPGWQ